MKTLQGVVTSLKSQKTPTVTVTTRWQHPMYKKYVRRSKGYACHVEGIELTVGDNVLILGKLDRSVKPSISELSRNKRNKP